MNRGDAQALALNITVNDEPITSYYADELELTFNPELYGHSVRKTLSGGDIYWDVDTEKFYVHLSQKDTFTLLPGPNTWQLRLLKDGSVISNLLGKICMGEVNSKHILRGGFDGR